MRQEMAEDVLWTESMSLGLATMDNMHQEFFSEVARLTRASDEEFIARFTQFIGMVEQAFHKEEGWMVELDFPGFRQHLEEHAMVLSALHHAAPHIAEGDLGEGREIIKLFPLWFVHHLGNRDKPLALALQMASIPV